jgi:hypothetical protein
MGTEPESVYAQKGTMQDVLVRSLKKTEAQVCISSIHVYHLDKIHNHVTYVLAMTNVHFHTIKGVYFSQVKNKP